MDEIHKTPPAAVDPSISPYPSQQEGFIPLDFSSPVQKKHNQQNKPHHHQQTPYFRNNQNRNNYYQNNRNRNFQQNNFRQNDGNNDKFGRFSDQGNNSKGFFQQNHINNFHNRRGKRNSGGHYHNQNIDISQYYHPTMMEDPWKELIERHNAMKGDNNDDSLLNESKSEKSNSPHSSTDE